MSIKWHLCMLISTCSVRTSASLKFIILKSSKSPHKSTLYTLWSSLLVYCYLFFFFNFLHSSLCNASPLAIPKAIMGYWFLLRISPFLLMTLPYVRLLILSIERSQHLLCPEGTDFLSGHQGSHTLSSQFQALDTWGQRDGTLLRVTFSVAT